MTVTTLGLAAAAFGIAMGLSPLLQVRHMVARGSSADVSLPFLLVLLAGFVLWLAYGVALGNAALIVSNAVAITSYAITTAAVLRLRQMVDLSAARIARSGRTAGTMGGSSGRTSGSGRSSRHAPRRRGA